MEDADAEDFGRLAKPWKIHFAATPTAMLTGTGKKGIGLGGRRGGMTRPEGADDWGGDDTRRTGADMPVWVCAPGEKKMGIPEPSFGMTITSP